MATLTIQDVPDEILDHLRKAAALERRSLNQQVIHLPERTLIASGMRNRIADEAARQVEAWRSLAGRWRSGQTAAQEIGDLYAARIRGRDVKPR